MYSLSVSTSLFAQTTKFATKPGRRTSRRPVVTRATALPQKKKHALTVAFRVPSSKEKEADAIFKSHERFMNSTHVIGDAETDDVGHPRLLEYYVAKTQELTDLTDPASCPTGDVLYTVVERYVSSSGFQEHVRLGNEKWNDFPKFLELARSDPDAFFSVNGAQLTTFRDAAEPCLVFKNNVNLVLGICVPKPLEPDIDALLMEHEQFMRETHALVGVDGVTAGDSSWDDLYQPRLTHFSVNKAYELVDPFDESKGKTGNVQYSICETYVNANGVSGHFRFRKEYPSLYRNVMETFTDPEFVKFCDLGNGRVVTAMAKPRETSFTSNIINGVKGAIDKVLPKRAPHEEWCEEYCPEKWQDPGE